MKVAIAGYGIEGKASLAYWRGLGDHVTVLDERTVDGVPGDTEVVVGPDVFQNLTQYDLVVRTASLRPDKLRGAKKVWSATNEFFEKCPAQIVGVTGTKGKGTTCSLVVSILRSAGKTVHLVGNIGTPALEVLPSIKPNDVVVYELSSFQLWDLEKSPHIAVVLMIEPDHLDVHVNFDEYIEAKQQIVTYQTSDDIVFYNPTNLHSKQIAIASKGQKIRYGTPEGNAVYVKENKFFTQGHLICGVDTLQLVGRHNLENACAAISAVLAYDKNTSFNDIKKGLHDFTGLPHRLRFVREVSGVKYYDDSIATTPGSAIAALDSFVEPKIIILGGFDKGADYSDVVAKCRDTNTVVLAVGQTGEKIFELAKHANVVVHRLRGLMDEVVAFAYKLAEPGTVVILSPASASFGQYKNYSERGDQFVEAVKQLAN